MGKARHAADCGCCRCCLSVGCCVGSGPVRSGVGLFPRTGYRVVVGRRLFVVSVGGADGNTYEVPKYFLVHVISSKAVVELDLGQENNLWQKFDQTLQ